jgi:hypothetical protein
MRRLFVLLAAAGMALGVVTATGPTAAGGTAHAGACASHTKMGRFSGIVRAQSISGPSCDPTSPLGADPPLVWHGGPVMSIDHGPITITPIFWEPNGYFNAGDYRNIIDTYLGDVAAASGSDDNVYSTATEYPGSNGNNGYDVVLGAPIRDHNPFPKGNSPRGCSVGKLDQSGIYADGSGYTACLSDAQVTAEIQNVINAAAGGPLPSDYNHEYVMLTPKHVASCFFAGSTASKKNVCTIDHYPSGAYCAYHTMFGPDYPASGTVYANMPYPVYHSPVGFTCGTDAGGHGTIESPNFNGSASSMDADVEVSPLSHEVMESITDPNTTDGWFDGIGNENGDDCAYVYGNGTWTDLGGTPGRFYNQTINGDHYITQEEFSNADWFHTDGAGGCVRSESAVTPAP